MEHTDSCWADLLDSRERAKLGHMLARYCKNFYDASQYVVAGDRKKRLSVATIQASHGLQLASAEMSELHLDLTERACTAPDTARRWAESWAAKNARRTTVRA